MGKRYQCCVVRHEGRAEKQDDVPLWSGNKGRQVHSVDWYVMQGVCYCRRERVRVVVMRQMGQLWDFTDRRRIGGCSL